MSTEPILNGDFVYYMKSNRNKHSIRDEEGGEFGWDTDILRIYYVMINGTFYLLFEFCAVAFFIPNRVCGLSNPLYIQTPLHISIKIIIKLNTLNTHSTKVKHCCFTLAHGLNIEWDIRAVWMLLFCYICSHAHWEGEREKDLLPIFQVTAFWFLSIE